MNWKTGAIILNRPENWASYFNYEKYQAEVKKENKALIKKLNIFRLVLDKIVNKVYGL